MPIPLSSAAEPPAGVRQLQPDDQPVIAAARPAVGFDQLATQRLEDVDVPAYLRLVRSFAVATGFDGFHRSQAGHHPGGQAAGQKHGVRAPARVAAVSASARPCSP